ncbi:hypothetical protein BT96DRAFT_1002480 [Gymnopus androsaceus JB14]|uniref:Uncharacterized protein n=1 Tax=Gymnopus androsaceus JB14 TaxID=1447944 RepID=A0A6A4GXS3_9AGAR|nr:hypothetical protein BT96DRAFT_1002480 [Gymnopus androsaceus JB14]
MLLPKIILFDAKRLVGNNGDCRDPNKLQLTQFVENAWEFHVRIVNWPVGVPFIKCGVMSKKGFRQGFNMPEGKDIEDPGDCVEMVSWDKEEIDLPIEDQHNIAVVTDTKGNVVVSVSNSPTYQAAMGIEDQEEEEEDQGDKDPTLWADSTPPCPTRQPVSRGRSPIPDSRPGPRTRTPSRPTRRPVWSVRHGRSPIPDSHPGPRPRPVVASRAPPSTRTVSPARPAAAGPSCTSQTRSVSPARPPPPRASRTSHPPSRQSAASQASQPLRDERESVHGTRRPLSPVGEESERPTKQLKQSSVPKHHNALHDALKKKLGTRK